MISQALWVAGGQLVAALGVLVGVRLQTEVIPPEVYGEAILLTGLSTLAITVVGVPYSRGAMLFYGTAASFGLEERLFDFVRKSVAKQLGIAIVIVIVCGWTLMTVTGGSRSAVIALSALLAVDSIRTVEMSFLSARRQQQQYALWSVMEAWGRPALAVIAVLILDAKVEVILAAYLTASIAVLFLFIKVKLKSHQECSESEQSRIRDITEQVVKYSRPLLPQGLVGWLGALSDRYLLAALVGLHEAGIYSAIYGLVSRPFLLAQGISELTIRPAYFHAVNTNSEREEANIFQRWLLMNCAVGLALLVLYMAGSSLITGYLLGAAYSGGSILIPYLAVGHLFLIVGYCLNGYLYAHQYTRQLFIFDLLAVLLGLGVGLIAMNNFGVIGAASTCAAVFMARSAAVAVFVCRKNREVR